MKTRRGTVLNSVITCMLLALPVVASESNTNSATSETDTSTNAPSAKDANETQEMGTVVFYRPRSAKGGAIRLNISGGDTGAVGPLSNGSKIIKEMPAGEFTFEVNSPSIAGRDTVTLKIEPGKTYYVKGIAKLGWPAARARFTLMDAKKGKAESDKIK